MACNDLPNDPHYGVGGTFADGVGSGGCGDTVEAIAIGLSFVFAVAAAVAAARSKTKFAALLALSAAAAAGLFCASLNRLVYYAPVLVQHRRAAAWQSRQFGVPVITAVLVFLFSVGLRWGSDPDGSCSRICCCVYFKVIDAVNGAYTAAAVTLAVLHPASAVDSSYQTFDAAGVALACVWAALTVAAISNAGGSIAEICNT
jgi:hypothetical protein